MSPKGDCSPQSTEYRHVLTFEKKSNLSRSGYVTTSPTQIRLFFRKQAHAGIQSLDYTPSIVLLLSATSRFLTPVPSYGLFALVSKLWKIFIFALSKKISA